MRHESSTGPTDPGDPRPAPPPSPGPGRPSEGKTADTPFSWQTLTLLRSIGVAVAEQWVHDGLIAAAARVIAEDAHRAALPCERALVALKRAWSGLVEVRLLPRKDGEEVLAVLVTASIKAFFAPAVLPAPLPPVDQARERAESVARTLLGVIAACVPEAPAAAADTTDGERDAGEGPDPEVERRLVRALAKMPDEEITTLIEALHSLHDALRVHRWPRATGARAPRIAFQPPTH